MEYNIGDLIICTVKDVVKTTVFVQTEDGMKGSIVFSEIAPGRIRNIRDYVVPNKIIVCKILHINDQHLFLSLRRVKEKERKELLEKYKREKSLESVIKKIIGEKAIKIIDQIKLNEGLQTIFGEDQSLLKKYFTKEEIEKLNKISYEKKEKEREVKKEFSLSCKHEDGIVRIKRLLSKSDYIFYLGASKFVIKIKTKDPKHADSQINKLLEEIEKDAKKEKCEFNLVKSKS